MISLAQGDQLREATCQNISKVTVSGMILELEENAFYISENFITSSYKLSLTELNKYAVC